MSVGLRWVPPTGAPCGGCPSGGGSRGAQGCLQSRGAAGAPKATTHPEGAQAQLPRPAEESGSSQSAGG